jgi:transposase
VEVVDHALTHCSKAFIERVEQLQKQNLYIFFLPPYSPELNKIVILWEKIKYQWIEFDGYLF